MAREQCDIRERDEDNSYLVFGDAAPMPGKNGIRPSADQTRSCTDDRDDDNDDDSDGVGCREGLR